MVLRGFMTKSVVFLPVLFACSVGTYGETMQGTDGSMMADRDTCVNRVATANDAHNHAVSGAGDTPATAAGPRSGTGCLAAATCHGTGGAGGQFTFAGTAYKEMGTGVTPAVGATVRIFMPGTKTSLAKAVTDKAGNFYTQTVVTFPAAGLETDITACDSTPNNIIPMIAPIRANEANCSSSESCHIVPGPRPMFLPGG